LAERVLHGRSPNISLDTVQHAVSRLIDRCDGQPRPF
jgi:hypothetical protein